MHRCNLLMFLFEMASLKIILVFYFLFQLIISCVTKEIRSINCMTPMKPLYGEFKVFRNSYVPTDIITFSCSLNAYLFGSRNLACNSEGQWNDSVPICATTSLRKLIMNGKELSMLTDGNYSTCFSTREKLGLEFIYIGNSSDVILRIIHNQIDVRIPVHQNVDIKINEKESKKCKRKRTYLIGHNKFHELECIAAIGSVNTIYPFSSLRNICEIELFWKQNYSCPNLNMDPVKGSIRFENTLENKIVYGTVAIYSCKAEYQLLGESRIYCAEYGKWTGNGTTCTGCGNYSSVENGQLIYTNKSTGGIVRLKCNKNYISKTADNMFSVCQPNGTWTLVPFECQEILCSESPPKINGMKWTFENSPVPVGYKATGYCYPNYALFNGPSVIECLQNGKWSKTNAICKAPLSNTKIIIIASSIGAGSSALVFIIILCIIVCRKRLNKKKTSKDNNKSNNAPKSNPMEGNEYFTIVYEEVSSDKIKKPTSPLPKLPSCETEFNYCEPIDHSKNSEKGNRYMYTVPQDAVQIPTDNINSDRKRRNSSADSSYWRDCDEFEDKSDVFKNNQMSSKSINKLSVPDFSMTRNLLEDLYSI